MWYINQYSLCQEFACSFKLVLNRNKHTIWKQQVTITILGTTTCDEGQLLWVFLAQVVHYLPLFLLNQILVGYYITTANTPIYIATEYNISSILELILLFFFKLMNKITSVNHLHIISRIVSLVSFRWEDVLYDDIKPLQFLMVSDTRIFLYKSN